MVGKDFQISAFYFWLWFTVTLRRLAPLKQQLPREEARQKQKRQKSAWGGKKTEQWGSAVSPVGQQSFYKG